MVTHAPPLDTQRTFTTAQLSAGCAALGLRADAWKDPGGVRIVAGEFYQHEEAFCRALGFDGIPPDIASVDLGGSSVVFTVNLRDENGKRRLDPHGGGYPVTARVVCPVVD